MHLKPWLTEVQTGPGLSHDVPVKAKLIPGLVQQAALLGLNRYENQYVNEAGPASSGFFETLIDERKDFFFY